VTEPSAIIFGYGFTGRSVDRALTNSGYRTVGVRRDWSDKHSQNLHSEPVEANITEPDTFDNLPNDPNLVVNCVSSGSRGDVDRYRSVYYEGSKTF
jgi:nucleoside-diphosphate-sugar epimerase